MTTRTITVKYDLPFPPAKVWRALTEPELLTRWLMPNTIAPTVGHKFTFKTQPMGEWDGTVECEVLEVQPLKRLIYSWAGGSNKNATGARELNTVVTWTLREKPEGTLLLLEHSGFRAEDQFAYEGMGKGWRSHGATRLRDVLATL